MTVTHALYEAAGIYHDHRIPVVLHDCSARIWADCAGPCGRLLVLCEATDEEVAAIVAGIWRCSHCDGVS